MQGTTTNIATVGVGSTVNVGNALNSVAIESNNLSIESNEINIRGPIINIGTSLMPSTITIGNIFSDVFIESRDNAAINVGNFFSQFP